MDINNIILATVSLGTMGLLFGGGLAYTSQKFAVKIDPRAAKIREVLPGANCGACGFPGCDGFSNAVIAGKVKIDACPVCGAETAEKIAKIMGISAEVGEKKVARVLCKGGDNCQNSAIYEGISSCRAEIAINGGGSKACAFGCLGKGDCVSVCSFDAIHINDYGVAEVDPEKCTACGVCIEECPKNIIELVPYKQKIFVDCINTEIGGYVKKNCINACIGCKICVKACPYDAIHVENNIARIDYDKCTGCGLCAEKCPTKAITIDENNKFIIV
ncbi:MAG: RnfABCDGE type electron transport complex subunit B [Clostridiales bacterium]|nr:RnfABCDGE type electron transport complex subunit B [Clostridiales bacterium]